MASMMDADQAGLQFDVLVTGVHFVRHDLADITLAGIAANIGVRVIVVAPPGYESPVGVTVTLPLDPAELLATVSRLLAAEYSG